MSVSLSPNALKDAAVDAKESTRIRFEWTVRGLKSLFDKSNGEAKSKVTKSPRFGDGRWQILFYPNSGVVGTDGQTFVSLYLSCEPTLTEKDNAINGRWSREGLFDFGFEIWNVSKLVSYGTKEAHDHSFSFPGAQNWGWAQFARRDNVYYNPASVRQNDAFVIVCTLTSSLAKPASIPAIPRHLVPKDLLDCIGSMLDDPLYSDVEFVLPQRGKAEARKIYASRKMLRRVDYFDAMFSSGWAESSSELEPLPEPSLPDDASLSDVGAFAQQFDDSDFEDEDEDPTTDNDHSFPVDESDIPDSLFGDGDCRTPLTSTISSGKWVTVTGDEVFEHGHGSTTDADDQDRNTRSIRPKLSHPSTPRSRELALEHKELPTQPAEIFMTRVQPDVPGPKKARVVVRDVAYTTYRAILYYIYTDKIVFAPLSSSFLTSTSQTAVPSVASTPAEGQSTFALSARANQPSEASAASPAAIGAPRSRKEWMGEWERSNVEPGRPRPASAKSVYRLADKLELQDLKERAFRHIIRSLTVDNVVHEAFSGFSAAFEDVRKVEISYMFEHWQKVRAGAMLTIGQQLRVGRHPGFEEVWPAIIQHLAYEEKKAEEKEE